MGLRGKKKKAEISESEDEESASEESGSEEEESGSEEESDDEEEEGSSGSEDESGAKSMVRLATMFVLSEYSSSDVGQYSSGKLRVS